MSLTLVNTACVLRDFNVDGVRCIMAVPVEKEKENPSKDRQVDIIKRSKPMAGIKNQTLASY